MGSEWALSGGEGTVGEVKVASFRFRRFSRNRYQSTTTTRAAEARATKGLGTASLGDEAEWEIMS
jgi:hypothetical protein